MHTAFTKGGNHIVPQQDMKFYVKALKLCLTSNLLCYRDFDYDFFFKQMFEVKSGQCDQ